VIPKKSRRSISIIACGVFRPFLDALQMEKRYPEIHFTCLPPNLHIFPLELKNLLHREIASSQKKGEQVICLYGNCFPDMEMFCRENRATKVAGHTCYEMFLGRDSFRKIMDETAGTYFLEKELIMNFEEYCMKPLELEDEEMRSLFFRNYTKVLYLRQPKDPDLRKNAEELAVFMGLLFEVRDVDYTHLERELAELIGMAMEEGNEAEE
jgi:hypothetical protein